MVLVEAVDVQDDVQGVVGIGERKSPVAAALGRGLVLVAVAHGVLRVQRQARVRGRDVGDDVVAASIKARKDHGVVARVAVARRKSRELAHEAEASEVGHQHRHAAEAELAVGSFKIHLRLTPEDAPSHHAARIRVKAVFEHKAHVHARGHGFNGLEAKARTQRHARVHREALAVQSAPDGGVVRVDAAEIKARIEQAVDGEIGRGGRTCSKKRGCARSSGRKEVFLHGVSILWLVPGLRFARVERKRCAGTPGTESTNFEAFYEGLFSTDTTRGLGEGEEENRRSAGRVERRRERWWKRRREGW